MFLRRAIKSFVLVMLTLPSSFLLCQNETVVQMQTNKTPPTLPVLYRFFLAYQLHLERKADALKQVGKNGEDLRTYYQKKLGFSDGESATIHQSAVHLEEALQGKDGEAQKVIQDARAMFPKGVLPKGSSLPDPPERLKTLQAEREALIASEISTLQKALPPADVVKLENFLRTDFAPAVTVKTPLPNPLPRPFRLAPEGK